MSSDDRWPDLVEDLEWVAKRLLRHAYKQAGDLDEREYPTLAGVVKDLVGGEQWQHRSNLSLIEVVRIAVGKLPETMAQRKPEDRGKERVPRPCVDGPERHLAEVLYGFADKELTPRPGKDREHFTYSDYFRAVQVLAGLQDYSDNTVKRTTHVIREDLASILLDLTPTDLLSYQQVPTPSGQPTQVTPDDEPAPTTFPRDRQQTDSGVTACAGIANVTAGSTAYYGAVDAWYDQVVKLLLTYFNDGPDHSDHGVTPRLEPPQRINGERWKLGWHVQSGSGIANPSVTVNLKRTDAVLTYIPGSTVWQHNTTPPGEPADIGQEIVPDADILVPSRPLDTLHWGDDYTATITALFRVQIPGIRIVVQAQSPANGNWLQELYARPNARLPMAVTVQNVGNTGLYGVVVGVSLPPYSAYATGSTVLATGLEDTGRKLPDGVADRSYQVPDSPPTTRGGVNLGTLAPGQEAVVRFVMQLDAQAGADMRAVGFVSATGHNEYYNTLVIYTEPEG